MSGIAHKESLREVSRPRPPFTIPSGARLAGGNPLRNPAATNELVIWRRYLAHLHEYTSVTREQVRAARELWERARRLHPELRPPRAGVGEDGLYFMSWSFVDMDGVTFDVSFAADGRASWFFQDSDARFVRGTEEDFEDAVPDEALGYLTVFTT